MATITEAIDGDTFRRKDEQGRDLSDLRIANVDTQESVHRDESKNTGEGREASKLMKTVAASGNMRQTHDYGRDHHDRGVGSGSKTINGVDIDLGFVAMAAGYSSYNTRFGKAKDPTLHSNYKEFWSDKMPYQAGEFRKPMDPKDWQEIADATVAFDKAYSNLRNGENSAFPKWGKEELQEDFDQALYNLHKDQNKVAHFQHANAGWGKQVTEDNYTASDQDSILLAIGDDPVAMEKYNRTMRQEGLSHVRYPEQEKGFWEKFGATFSQMSSIANHTNARETSAARLNKEVYDIPVEDFTEGVPQQFHTAILEEVDVYGEAAGLEKRKQVLEDIETHKITDDMPWYSQLGYGLLTAVTDPISYAVGLPVAKGVQATTKAIPMFQLASNIQGRTWAASGIFGNTAKVGTYVTAGMVESAAVTLPQLGGDHMYTARDYGMDIIIGGVLGGGLGLGIDAVGAGLVRRADKKALADKTILEQEKHVENMQEAKHRTEEAAEKEVEIQNAGKSQETVNEWVGGTNAGIDATEAVIEETTTTPVPKQEVPTQKATGHANINQPLHKQKFTPWEVISKISTKNYQKVARKIRKIFPEDSHIGVLINQQVGLNNKKLTPETKTVSEEINSEIIHLASVYPDGKVPKSVEDTIQGVGYTQKDASTVNVIDQVLQGKSANQSGLLSKYNDKLDDLGTPAENVPAIKDLRKRLREAENGGTQAEVDTIKTELAALQEAPKPLTSLDFFARFSDIMNMERKADKDDIFTLTQDVPREVSFIKDMLEMNVQARKSKDADFKKQVERLNGSVAKKLDDLDAQSKAEMLRSAGEEVGLTAIFNQQTKSHGKTVKLTGDEIVKRLRQEGLEPKTPKWKKRFAELRKGSAFVSPEVNKVGKLDKAVVGTKHTSQDVDGPESAFINDARVELDELNKLPPERLEAADKARIKELQSQIDNQFSEKSKGLEHEADTNDILPRTLTETDSVNAYKQPTLENLTKLRDKLRAINKKNGSTVVPKQLDELEKRVKLKKITARLMKNPALTIQRVVDNGTLGDVVDVIRASNTLANTTKMNTKPAPKAKAEPKLKDTQTKPKQHDKPEDTATPVITPEEVDLTKPVTEEEIDILVNEPEKLAPDETVEITTRAKAASKQLVEEKANKIDAGIAEWVRVGGEKLLVLSAAPNHAADYVGRLLTRLTKSVGEIFVDSNLTTMRWFGVHVTEISRGFGGKAKRQFSAAVIKDKTFKESITKGIPQYRKAIEAYAASKGKGALGQFKARERSGDSSDVVDSFNKDLFLVQEYRRQGKPIPKNIHKSVTDFADQFDHYMDHNHNVLVAADTAGFTAGRKVKHYIPHVWQRGKVNNAIRKHGRTKVVNLLAKGYRNLDDKLSEEQSIKQAESLIEHTTKKPEKGDVDPYSPTMDARAKTRKDIDTTTEIDGVSVMDLLDTDVVSVMTKYSHRVGGWVGLSKGTNGLLKSQLDVDTFIASMKNEAAEKGVNVNRHVTMVEDTIAQILGRPTSNFFSKEAGLPPELRNLADLAVLTKMGGLGSSQLIETGQALTRTSMMAVSEPKAAAKILSMGRRDKSDRLLIEEIQAISNITDDLEFLDRQQVHLDQNVLEEINKVRQLSIKIAETATGGELKAEASRGLGKLSGYNMVRRFQSRAVQASFVLDIANHFTKGTGVMGNARMADVGLTNTQGINEGLKDMFTKYAEFDDNGVLQKLNIQKWDPDIRDEMAYAIIRDEAQQIQRTHIGELPPWMNKPIMGLIFQFRQMPIVANSKSLGRAIAFADKEAVTGVVLNTAMAGLVRYSKFAVLGTATAAAVGKLGSDKEVTSDQTQIDRYIAQLGINSDFYDLIFGRSGVASVDTDNGWKAFGESAYDAVSGQIPVMGLMNDYYEAGEAGMKGDLKGLADSAENLMMLGNLALAEVMFAAIQPLIDKLPTKASLPELPKFKPEVKTRTPKPTAEKPMVEPKPTAEKPMVEPKPKSTKALHGKQAVAKVEEVEGPLNSMEKRIVELEGFSAGDYDDDVGVSTSGVGQTGEFKGKTFKETVKVFVNKAKKTFNKFDEFDDELQTELVQLYYRGDVKASYNWVKAVNNGDFEAASEKLLDHKEYKRRKAVKNDGVTKRLEEASKVLAKQ